MASQLIGVWDSGLVQEAVDSPAPWPAVMARFYDFFG
jgi:hypothetical protein